MSNAQSAVDAFILCAAVDEVAARVWQYREAGMDLPLIQPVLQDEDQVHAVIQAAIEYGSQGSAPVLLGAAAESNRGRAGPDLGDARRSRHVRDRSTVRLYGVDCAGLDSWRPGGVRPHVLVAALPGHAGRGSALAHRYQHHAGRNAAHYGYLLLVAAMLN
jgi:hypothetical protein